MHEAAAERHKKWDDMLNEVYSQLKQQLTKDDFAKLETEEADWIKTRDEKAEAAANEFKGGSMENVNRTMSLAQTTKDRCYELVNGYMK